VRPKTIVYFEWIIFGTLLLSVLRSYLDWDAIAQAATTLNQNPSFVSTLITLIFIFVLIGALTLLVSRRRSKIAMWVSLTLFALDLFFFIQSIFDGLVLGSGVLFFVQLIVVLQTVGKGVAYGLLFTPSARGWMNREDTKDEKLGNAFH